MPVGETGVINARARDPGSFRPLQPIGIGAVAYDEFQAAIQAAARDLVETLEREDRLGIVILGRSYHHDPGINQGIFEDLQKLGLIDGIIEEPIGGAHRDHTKAIEAVGNALESALDELRPLASGELRSKRRPVASLE